MNCHYRRRCGRNEPQPLLATNRHGGTELFKQFNDNEGFRRWLTDGVRADVRGRDEVAARSWEFIGHDGSESPLPHHQSILSVFSREPGMSQ